MLLATVLLGAGCQPMAKKSPQPTPSPTTERPAAKQGFGKLPALPQAGGATGMEVSSNFSMGRSMAVSSIAPMAVPAPASEPAADTMVTNVGGGVAAIRAPYPDSGPAKVMYDIKGELPTWGTDGNVYRVRQAAIDNTILRSIASIVGVPSQVASMVSQIQGVNVSWRDQAGFTWNADLPGRNLNWWKNVDYSKYEPSANNNQKLDKAQVLAAADNFLRDHGFPQFAGKGILEETPMIMPLLRGEAMPCAMSARPEAAPAAEDAKLMIYPSPCGYPIQVSVYYPDMRDGMPVSDMGGWPSRKASIQIDIKDNSVVGGNVMLDTEQDASSYSLISSEDAMKRLMAGGNNPVYGWYDGTGVKEVRATISSVKLGWMRHDSWEEGISKVYYLPALIAEGTVDRGNNSSEPEIYHTVVPLVADSEFQTSPSPIMYMKAEPAVIDVAPAPTPAVAPKQ